MKNKITILPLVLLLTGCSFYNNPNKYYVCENYYSLTSDFKHKYEEDDYFEFIDSSSISFYYDNPQNKNGNCHYNIIFKDGKYIDEWSNYSCTGKTICFDSSHYGNMEFEFSYYNSPTIDYVLIGLLTYDEKNYHLIYTPYYIFSTNG